ncbi:MAG: DASS family sodium-coupled anion symporter [Myxococcales bacterium]|nr:DASS family sodium-coupled anion symporter [Myxococcales bacterium]MCB9715623.1 DASS family sodium-coupled anion symporter [Myxococcales bacterium]
MVEIALSEAEARFDRRRRAIGLVTAPVVLVALIAMPMPGLSQPAHTLAGVAAMTVVLWVTEAVPLAVAALLGPALAVLLGVAEAKVALAAFGDPLIFLFLGGFLLASGLARQGFDRRAALWLVSRRFVGGSPKRALYTVGFIGFTFSMWISNTAATAMLIPVVLGLYETVKRVAPGDAETRRKLDRFGGGMCLALAYASSLGGSATPIGTAPNVIALGMLEEQAGMQIDFGTWMAFGVPSAAVMTVVMLIITARAFPAPVARVEGLTAEVERLLADLGPMTKGERRMLVVFALTVAGWLLPAILKLSLGPGHAWSQGAKVVLDEGVVAMVGACLLFMVPSGERSSEGERVRLLDWEAAQRIDWGTLMLLGGGFALGKLTFQTGLAEAIGRGVLDVAGPIAEHPAGLLAASTLLVIFLTEVTSNTATTSMMLPVIIGIAKTSGFPPVATAVAVTLAASYAFMLPVSTPPNAMAYGTRLVRLDTMVRLGFRLDLVGFVVLTLVGIGVLQAIFG